MAAGATEAAAPDLLLGGRVRLFQPAVGYRVAIDPVLLAAAVPAAPGERAVELGSGTGAAALCVAARVPGCDVTGLEPREDFLALARRSAAASGLAERVRFVAGDLAGAARLGAAAFDHAFANPPHRAADATSPPADAQRRAAHVEGEAALADWIAALGLLLRPGGTATMIHRADRLGEILAALAGRAATVVAPLWPKAGRPAKRVLVRWTPGRRAKLVLAAGLVLHRPDGGYTAEAEAVLRGAAPLVL